MANTKITTNVIADNAVGITQLNVSDGSNGQVLTTNGSGTLSFSTVSGTTINNNANNRVITGSGTANTLEGEANFVFDASNSRVGIGTTSPANNLHIHTDSGDEGLTIKSTGDTSNAIIIDANRGNAGAAINALTGKWNGTSVADILFLTGDDTTNKDDGVITFRTSSADNIAERMRIDSAGKVGINTTTMNAELNVHAGATNAQTLSMTGLGSNVIKFAPYISSGAFTSLAQTNDVAMIAESAGGIVIAHHASGDNGIRIADNGDLEVGGALSKGSGSFKIDHPLESKKDTHYLVHSFIEGPQADNIYRGKVNLTSGTATVNIDTQAGMTEGTFVALNTNVQCFTTNETDWDSVKGTVSGNILTISCKNETSTATVSWLVIGERHDQHMKDTRWTNDEGKVIVEPLKPEDEEE